MENKKVAIMCFSGGSGGMEYDTVKLSELLSTVCDVTVFCKKGSFVHRLLLDQGQLSVVAVTFSSRAFSPSMLFNVRSEIKKRDIINVIFFGASELKTLYFSFLGLAVNLLVRHGTTKTTKKHDWFHRLIYSKVNAHVVLSNHLLKNVEEIIPRSPAARYKIIRQSYQYVRKKTDAMKAGRLSVLHVGRIASGKGQLDAIEACQVLHEKAINFQMTFVGAYDDADYKSELDKCMAGLSYGESIKFPGHVSEVASHLERSNVLLFPSKGEGMPNALIEAMHYGLVCIVYDNTVFPEFAKMGFYLHLVADGDVPALREKLLFVAENIEYEMQRARKNIDLALEVFSPERERADWLSLLD